jgi:hypothetical protein
MTRTFFSKALVPIAAAAATVALAAPAAAVQCIADPTAPLNLPNPILVVGSSAVKNLITAMGTVLANASPPISIIYSTPGSCQGVNVVFNSAPIGTGSATYFPAAGGTATCTLNNESAATLPQIASSDVSYASCKNFTFATLPAGIGEFVGPIQTMNFIVPTASTANAISAQAAYFVFGFPGGGMVPQWANTNSDANIFVRGDSSGTQSLLAVGINVPANLWQGTSMVNGTALSSSTMLSTVGAATAANANSTIGILSSDVIEGTANNTANGVLVKGLAFQAYDQTCPWYPNSASNTHDKQNVRDGHYVLWGAERFYTPIGSNNLPSNALAAKWVGYFDNSVAYPSTNGYQDLLKTEINQFLVPQCAMNVQRVGNVEVGPLTPATPTCDCLFDSLQKTGGTSCTACTSNASCPTSAPNCRYGYCEAN